MPRDRPAAAPTGAPEPVEAERVRDEQLRLEPRLLDLLAVEEGPGEGVHEVLEARVLARLLHVALDHRLAY